MERTAHQWTSVRLRAGSHETDSLALALELAGAQAITISPASEESLFHDPTQPDPPGLAAGWAECWVSGLFPGRPDPVALALAMPSRAWEQEIVEEMDWQQALHAGFQPLRFPPRLWVYPSWCEPPGGSEDVCIEIDPGLAFGTGAHPTTALCLEWLSARPAGSLPERMIDYGCGSGILAIAALRLGVQEALAVDIDPQALAVAADNARRNGVHDRMRCVDLAHALTPAPLVFANILAGPLVSLAPILAGATCRGGTLLLSGFSSDQEPQVECAYPGFEFERTERSGWILLAGTRKR
ncbi:MAG: 50S ribosomal protein L11 methyltransferase [Acidiferrobacteraceae bacterium]